MAITVTYANLDSAKRGMRKRGITYSPHHAPHRAHNQSGRHFDLDSAHVVVRTSTPTVVVSYYYFNLRNQPKARGAA